MEIRDLSTRCSRGARLLEANRIGVFWCIIFFVTYLIMEGVTIESLQQQLNQIKAVVEGQQGLLRTMSDQLGQAESRAQRAEADRDTLVRLFGPRGGESELVDTKGVGQPFKYNGKSDQDYSEWHHKMVTFLRAKFGSEIDEASKWAVRQRKVIQSLPDPGNNRIVSWDDVFGSSADALDQITGMSKFVDGLYTYLVSFTTGDANKVVRNSGPDGLECWRRLNSEYDPTSSMRRVAILGLVQNPQRCKSVDELGSALESWLAKKRQYEE